MELNDVSKPISWEDEVDYEFIKRVIDEVTQSCILPNPIPLDRIPSIILQAARWFWQNDDQAVERRMYLIKNDEFCRGNVFNKIIKLPPQIMAVCGVYKTSDLRYGNMGDFSVERMMMSTYTMFGGSMGHNGNVPGYNLMDMVASMYEVDTFNQTLNPTLSYEYNPYSKKLNILGDLGHSNIVIECWKRVNLQDLYENYYFFRYCVALLKRSLSQIFGTFSFKYPGGVEVNYSDIASSAQEELDEIKEYMDSQHSADYFYQPNTI